MLAFVFTIDENVIIKIIKCKLLNLISHIKQYIKPNGKYRSSCESVNKNLNFILKYNKRSNN